MNLFFREMGEGKPVIILHGLFGSSDNWLTVGKQLAEKYKIYLVDQRNHGQSGHDDVWTYEAMAGDLYEFIEEHQIEKPHIIGHSMGGKTAMCFASNYPEYLDKLVVVDIAPKYYPVHHQTILEGLNAIDLESLKSRKEAETILGNYVPALVTRQFLLKNMYRNTEGKFAWRINLPVITKFIENVGSELAGHTAENETLFVGGRLSNYILEEDHQTIHSTFSNAKIKMIEGAGHWIHAEKPKELLEELLEFLG